VAAKRITDGDGAVQLHAMIVYPRRPIGAGSYAEPLNPELSM
jgi:hypothetical protein